MEILARVGDSAQWRFRAILIEEFYFSDFPLS